MALSHPDAFSASFQRLGHIVRLHGGTQLPGDDVSGIVVENGRQIEPAPADDLEVSKVGLPLEAGPPQRLFDVARQINAEVPLRVSISSKANRGYALAAGETPGWSKFARPDLTGDVTVEDAMILAVQQCLDHLLVNETCLLQTDDPEGVHQVRIALRRLRSTLRLFRSVLAADQYRWLNDEIKWLTGRLAAARDWDVFTGEIVGPVAAHFPGEPGFAVVRSALAQRRRTSRRAARRAIRSTRYTEFVLGISGWLAQHHWHGQELNEASARVFGPVAGFADTVIAGRYRQVRKDGRKFATMTAEQRHQFRIEVKKLRYATDLFGSLYRGKRATRYLAGLGKLQDTLGYANDVAVAVAEDLTRRLCETAKGHDGAECRRAGAIVLGWHAHTMARAAGPLAKRVKRFIAIRPPHTKR